MPNPSSAPQSHNAFTIQTLTEADIPATARICSLSMAQDRHTLLKASYTPDPYDHEAGMHGAFRYFLSQPPNTTDCVKAVDSVSGEILGVVCWHTRLEDENKDKNEDESKDTKPPTAEAPSEADPKKPSILVSSTYEPDAAQDARAQLESLTSSHLAAYQREITSRTPNFMVIGTLAVHPDAQGRGVGSALIRHGTDRADASDLLCWVHSSDGAEGVYARAGFVEDVVLDLDLDEWARRMAVQRPEGEWGGYRFRYMVRLPQGVTATRGVEDVDVK